MRKLFVIILLIFGSFCSGCVDKNTIPGNFVIDDHLASWDEVGKNVNYRLEFTNTSTQIVIRKIVDKASVDLSELNLPEGDYMVKVQVIKNGKETGFSESLPYHQEDLNAVNEISGLQLTDGVYLKWMGRTHYNTETQINMIFHSTSGFEVNFTGTRVSATLTATKYSSPASRPYLVIVVDDDIENSRRIALNSVIQDVVLAEDLDAGDHKVALYKSTESIDSHVGLKKVNTDGKFIAKVEYKTRKIEVIAASSSTGFGNLGTSSTSKTTENSDAMQAYAFLSAQALNAEVNIFAASGWGCKFSPYTTPVTKNLFDVYKKVDVESTLDWTPNSYVPDVVVMNLGTNDYSYIRSKKQEERELLMQEFKDQYLAFINYVHTIHPDAKILILYGLMGESGIFDITEDIYQEAKKTIEHVYILRLSSDQAGCSSHPSAASHVLIAKSLTLEIKKITGWE